MSLDAVIDLVQCKTGLSPEAVGPGSLRRAVDTRMRLLGIADLAAYRVAVENPAEFDALVDEIVVPETWFFRGGLVFRYLAEEIIRPATTGRRVFRTLSVPCSTGEEPYSLAIALAEAQVARTTWSIDAVDVSQRHLDLARLGRYGELSFRQTPPLLRQHWFRPVDAKWEIAPELRSAVRFRPGNLLDPWFLGGEPPFDLILCRNLFIYLNAAARLQALAALDRLLAADGWLCMGHAEPIEFIDERFRRAGREGLFLYQRQAGATDRVQPLGHGLPTVPLRPTEGLQSLQAQETFGRTQGQDQETLPQRMSGEALFQRAHEHKPQPLDIAAARLHADAGQLSEALVACQNCLDQSGPSADLYSLMGIIFVARQELSEALTSFRKALYLQPDHSEALTHLLLLALRRGDQTQAALLQGRLARGAAGGDR